MDRRHFIASALALSASGAVARTFPSSAKGRTHWNVIGSEGYDAIAFLGALSGQELYRRAYAADADSFSPRLPERILADIPRLADEAGKSSFGLLWPVLANILSGAGVTTLDSVIASLTDLEGRVARASRANPSRNEEDLTWLRRNADRLTSVFAAMRNADFATFRRERLGPTFAARIATVSKDLSAYDVISWQEKLTGRHFDPTINVVLLAFSKPHGAKMQDQTFLQAADYDVATTVRIAAHEMLHPPMAMDGPAAKAALKVLERDQLIMRIVRDHDPRWGYTTLGGLLNEDICEALDQLISEELNVARDPADRWRKADDGMHVLAAGFFGLLKRDGWSRTGGNIEAWLAAAARSGRLAPAVLHPIAAEVLKRPVGQLWPLSEGHTNARPVTSPTAQEDACM